MLAIRPALPRHPDDRAPMFAAEPFGLVIRHSGPIVVTPHEYAVVPEPIVRSASASRPQITVDRNYTLRPNADIDPERMSKGTLPLPREVYGSALRQLPFDMPRRVTRTATSPPWDEAAVVDTSQLNTGGLLRRLR